MPLRAPLAGVCAGRSGRGHREQRVVIPVNGINRAVIQAVNFGRTMSRDVRAVFVTEDHEHGEGHRHQGIGAPLGE